jgi:glycosyltransferase involved in cell wall biosynthesis
VFPLAVYARALTSRPTGRGLYAREMLAALRRVAPDLELHLFAGDPVDWPGVRLYPARGAGLAADLWRTWRGVARDLAAIRPRVLWSVSPFLPCGIPRDLPVVITVHDLVWRDHPETMSRGGRWAGGWMERGIRRAQRIVCDSDFTRDRLAAFWPDRAGVAEVIRLAPNPVLRAAAPEPGLIDRLGIRRPFVLNVGTFEPRKNLPVLLAAMRALPDITLVQCGAEGWRVSPLLREADGMPNVKRLGYVGESALAALYRAALAAVFTSRYEGFHLPPLDAADAGCPVVVSEIPVHREVLGDAAVYAPLDDAAALAERIRALRDDPAMRASIARRLQARAARFSWDEAAARLVHVLHDLAAARPEEDAEEPKTPATA